MPAVPSCCVRCPCREATLHLCNTVYRITWELPVNGKGTAHGIGRLLADAILFTAPSRYNISSTARAPAARRAKAKSGRIQMSVEITSMRNTGPPVAVASSKSMFG